MTQSSQSLPIEGPQRPSPAEILSHVNSRPADESELSAPLSDVEPETTATAARLQSKLAAPSKAKRSYKTVDPIKRKQLIEMVTNEQKTIKEAANRLKINYSTAKHIIKSKKSEIPEKSSVATANPLTSDFQLPAKQGPSMDV